MVQPEHSPIEMLLFPGNELKTNYFISGLTLSDIKATRIVPSVLSPLSHNGFIGKNIKGAAAACSFFDV
jgi:hypothetical protein